MSTPYSKLLKYTLKPAFIVTLFSSIIFMPMFCYAQEPTNPTQTADNNSANGIIQGIEGASSCDACKQAILKAIVKDGQEIDNTLNNITETSLKFIYGYILAGGNPYTPEAIQGNYVNTKEMPKQASTTMQTLNSNTMNALGIITDPSTTVQQYSEVCGPDYCPQQQSSTTANITTGGTDDSQQQIDKAATIDATSLMGASYEANSQQAKATQDFIAFISGAANPVQSKLTTQTVQALGTSNAMIQEYRTDIRGFLTQMSMGLNSLYYLYTQHLQVSKAGTLAGLSQQNISPDQLDREMATRRIGNEQWYEQMSSANPTVIARESLFVLAEMRYSMYQEHKIQERMLAELAAIQLALNEQDRQVLSPLLSNINSQASGQLQQTAPTTLQPSNQ